MHLHVEHYGHLVFTQVILSLILTGTQLACSNVTHIELRLRRNTEITFIFEPARFCYRISFVAINTLLLPALLRFSLTYTFVTKEVVTYSFCFHIA